MPLELSNPKRFLPLLLFIGFVYTLLGKGWESFSADSSIFSIGIFVITVAVILWFFTQLRK